MTSSTMKEPHRHEGASLRMDGKQGTAVGERTANMAQFTAQELPTCSTTQSVTMTDDDIIKLFEDDETDEELWIEEEESSESESDITEESMTTSSTLIHDNSCSPRTTRQRSVPVVEDAEPETPEPQFKPERVPGLQLPEGQTSHGNRMCLRPVDFFFLFFTEEVVSRLCEYTNAHAHAVGAQKMSMSEIWTDVQVEEFYVFIGLLMYMSVIKVPRISMYWCSRTLMHGMWARRFLSAQRYKCLISFLTISDATIEDESDTLAKARFLMEHIRCKCMELFQAYMSISINERMVNYKCKYSVRQYSKSQPTLWGMKLWVLADSKTGYTHNFDVYLEKDTTADSSFDLDNNVMKLVKSLVGQGYHLFLDHFCTGVQLLKELVMVGIRACGTALVNLKDFSACLKNVKERGKKAKKGDVRLSPEEDVLDLQRKEKKAVSHLSTIHDADVQNTIQLKCKEKGVFKLVPVNQPQQVKDHNTCKNSVSVLNKLMGELNSSRRTDRWWKMSFFHLIDIARFNSYVLFNEFRENNPDIAEVQRPSQYDYFDFTSELIRQLGGIEENEEVPQRGQEKITMSHPIEPFVASKSRNCKLCYEKLRKKRKSRRGCSTCGFFFCFRHYRNCLLEAHVISRQIH